MKIRTKLILFTSILITFILFCLLAVTHIQFYIVRDYAYLENKAVFKSLQDEFQQYYAHHDESWEGIQNSSFEHSPPFVEIALVVDGDQLYQKGQLSLENIMEGGFQLKIHSNDRVVGKLYVMNESQYKTYEFRSIWYNILPNIILVSLLITGVAAVFIIFLLSWTLTVPIRKIIKGIDTVKMGEPEVILPVHRKDEFGAIARALQEMNDSLANLEQSRKQLLSDVAHELKTPLMIMQGEMELAQEMETTLSSEKISSLLDEVLRLSRLVHDVLDLSRLEAGGTELRPTTENIVAIIKGMVEKIMFLAEDKQIGVSMHISEGVIDVSVEKSRINQAIYNILINSIHYTNQGEQVQIRVARIYHAARQSKYACITIEDNGVGISAKDLPHIFNRFYRADHSRTRPSGGTGLGLAIAQQNILVHQGWIDVQSEVGKGTTFLIYLPIPPSI
ncbi:sensor histidine kinase [Cohnella nanjingensis]|uniref:histidine kinase n=1 Tax=Cohnella nanjingensis TaxID=1387779 RepID=A0A7X0RVL3_9BACL|nr:HAMP domain-containing sensor histidine kinase [Cohnella nanjingensis]MBB6674489.1 HAMP domain-containing histidine kinase [Cohnella nanjingensis]